MSCLVSARVRRRRRPRAVAVGHPAGRDHPAAEWPGVASLSIKELDRKPSSCPFLFTWNGKRFEFVTDFMGGGEMGDWEGPASAISRIPVEYVRIRGDQLKPRDGRFEFRVTNELEETLFVDRFGCWRWRTRATSRSFPTKA